MNVIRKHREAAGLTQAEVSRRCGIARSNLSAIEAGKRSISPTLQNQILDAIGRPSVALRDKRAEVLQLIAKHGCTNPRVFGSVARGEDGPNSDIDILVHPDYQNVVDFIRLPRELAELLDVNVDVVSDCATGRSMAQILASAVPL